MIPPLSPTIGDRIQSTTFYLCIIGCAAAIAALVVFAVPAVIDALPAAFDVFNFEPGGW